MIYGGCNCGNCHITISSNGDVMACRRVTNSKVANVFENRLADVWICQMENYTKYKEMIRLSGKAYAIPEEEQIEWRDKIFEEQPGYANMQIPTGTDEQKSMLRSLMNVRMPDDIDDIFSF